MQILRFLFFLISLMPLSLVAQQPSKEELQKRTQDLLKEISTIKQDLQVTQKDKKLSLGALRSVERKISIRNQVINNMKTEVWMVEREIIRTYRDIDTLKLELNLLKQQYAQSIQYAYKNRSNYDFLNFIFSSSSFGDAMKRVSYLKTYRSFREQKAGDITRTEQVLKNKLASLSGKREEKSTALTGQSAQIGELEKEKKEKDAVVSQLQSKERELTKYMTNKEKERKQIQSAIAAVIKREKDEAIRIERAEAARRKAAEDAARKSNAANNADAASTVNDNTETAAAPVAERRTTPTAPVRKASVLESTPEGLISSQKFEENKGSLPWPVDKGVITLHFGKNSIPGKTKTLTIPSDGLSIETNIGAPVKAIFDGEISSVFNVGGYKIVMVKHGRYFTTYGNLSEASVSRGQKIARGQVLGSAGINDEGVGEVTLRLDTEIAAINPEPWLRK